MFSGVIEDAKQRAKDQYDREQRELRDRFAMTALAGIMANDMVRDLDTPHQVAQLAFMYADAMLAERNKQPRQE